MTDWKQCWRAFAILACCLALSPVRAAGNPQKVLVIGDSMMRITANALVQELGQIPGVEVRHFTSLGSGLARLDAFDWMAKFRELIGDFDPDITVAWFGANDRQALKAGDEVIHPGAAGWDAEYAGRLGEAMDLLTQRDGARLYWLELPDMRDARIREDVAVINRLAQQQAESRSQTVFVLTRPLLSQSPGEYSPFVRGARGMPLQVRDSDGVHLNRAGADLISRHLRQMLFQEPIGGNR